MSRVVPVRSRRSAAVLATPVALVLAGCGGDSGGTEASAPLAARAVDGFIVGGSVACDGLPNGGTTAGGRFVCPADTLLASVRGGADVGFDENATSGGIPFVGELVAPAVLGWVTPLSTLAVAMATDERGYDRAGFAAAVDALASTFGQSDLDLSADPTRGVQLVRLNAQVHQVLAAFSATESEYIEASTVLAGLVVESAGAGRAYNLGSGVGEILEAVNSRLTVSGSALSKGDAALREVIAQVQDVNTAIDGAARPDLVFGAAVAAPVAGQALTIERDEVLFGYRSLSERGGAGSGAVSIEEFESDEIAGTAYAELGALYSYEITSIEHHATLLEGSGELFLESDAFSIERDLVEQTVSIGFSLDATDDEDERAIAVTTSDARVSARRGESDSLAIALPAGAELRVRSVSDEATVTTATIVLKEEHEFTAEAGSVNLSFWRIDRELERRGFGDLTERAGNYRMTVAIGGVRINERDHGEVTRAAVRSVDAGSEVVSGSGFEGYVTLLPGSDYYY